MEFKNYINKMLMLSAAAVAMSMTLLSCSDNDVNEMVSPVEPDDSKEYVIEVKKAWQCLKTCSWQFLPPPIVTRMSSMLC